MLQCAFAYREFANHRGSISAYTRILEGAESMYVLMGSATEDGFCTETPGLSGAMLDIGEMACKSHRDRCSPDETLDNIFMSASNFLSQDTNPEDCVGWLTAVSVASRQVHINWANGDEVWLIRRQQVIKKALGHTLRHKERSNLVPDLYISGLGRPYEETKSNNVEKLSIPWNLEDGDRILLLNYSILITMSEDYIAEAVSIPDLKVAINKLIHVTPVDSGKLTAIGILIEFIDSTKAEG